jgi:hypothetical protein
MEERHVYENFVEKHHGERLLGKCSRRWEENSKTYLETLRILETDTGLNWQNIGIL